MIGTRLGPYEITHKLGEGGMGEVYRATDSPLDREVAIKVLPEALAGDPDRLARFEREAKLLASLDHPNIAGIYEVGEAEITASPHAPALSRPHTRFLAMQLVEGETLAERIARGALQVEEALAIARQIAEALEAAHEKGIVHRDLKPQNVKINPEGTVKVLDFGLAKALDPAGDAGPDSASRLAASPTLTLGATVQGTLLGTAGYMAPEQAKGLPVDKRADIWAFGVVLWEMLTGRRLFDAPTAPETLAQVLTREVDLDALPPRTPAAIRRLLHRCLERSTKNRIHDIADARIVLDELLSGQTAEELVRTAPPSRASRARRATLAAFLIAVGGAGGWILQKRQPRAPKSTTRLSVLLPPEMPYRVSSVPGSAIAISRDGTAIAYVDESDDRDGAHLFLRRLGELAPRAIETVDGRANQPFFSLDGAWIGFFTSSSLSKVAAAGGRPVVLVPELTNATWLRASWSATGEIVYDTWNAGLRVVSADGGAVRVLTEPENEWHLGPQVVPGTRNVLFFSQSAASVRIEMIDLDGEGRRTILENASQPLPLASGHLLFQRDRGLFVAPFDARGGTVTGSAMPVSIEAMVDDPRVATPVPQVAVSDDGTLVYAPAPPRVPTEIVWVDRQGRSEPITSVPFSWPTLDLSPDGRQLALAVRDGSRARITTFDLARKTFTPLLEERIEIPTGPVYSANGREIYFARYGTHEGEVLAQKLEGGAPRLLGSLEGTWIAPISVSRDGRWLLGGLYHPRTQSDLWAIDLEASDPGQAAQPLVAGPRDEISPALSPDGRWLAYCATEESQSPSIYLQRFPGGESRVRVSLESGLLPRWSPDGRELFFLDDGGTQLLAVDVESEPTLRLGAPRQVFAGSFWDGWDTGSTYAVSPDGQRFVMVLEGPPPNETSELIVVQNWFTELERLVPGNRSGKTR